ncbi:MAG: hypothetical protein HUJ96_00165 [Marinilabiliaceae bacterium]|nr:hypothetical protein [Marinilabiliaceae bacterium]
MKKLVSLIAMLIIGIGFNMADETSENDNPDVYVCSGSQSKCYHRTEKCRGLALCNGDVSAISLRAAQAVGRRECKMCYKDNIDSNKRQDASGE